MKMHKHPPPRWQAAAAMTLAMAFTPAVGSAAPAALTGNARPVIEEFLLRQSAGLPGKVSIRIETPQSGALPPCEVLEPFLPASARRWGRISVGVRCLSGQPWTRYVPAYISVVSHYYVSTRQIEAGQTLALTDFAVQEGDFSTLPASVVVNSSELNGTVAVNRIASGAPIRRESVRGVSILQQGQNVKVITRGAGFVISTEGKAMTSATMGTLVQVKMQGGQLTSGIVGPDGIVERAN